MKEESPTEAGRRRYLSPEMQALRKIEHSVLAFYGMGVDRRSMETLYEQALAWMERFSCVPHLVGTNLASSVRKFRAGDRRIRSVGFASLDHFELDSIPDDVANQTEATNCTILFRPEKRLVIDFCSSVVHVRSPEFLRMAEEACRLVRPTYGIGYTRPFGWGPTYYAMCLGKGEDAPDDISGAVSDWNEALCQNLYFYLRDVYPLNFLTAVQLNNRVGSVPLREWIGESADRGVLSPFTDTVTLWTVPDERIPELRQTLFDARVIFCFERDLWDNMQKYHLSREEVAECLRTGKPFVAKPAPKPRTIEEVLGIVTEAYGYTSPEEAKIIKVEQPGKTKELSEAEKAKIIKKKPGGKKPGQ